MTITMQGFAKINRSAHCGGGTGQPATTRLVWAREQFRATTTGDLTDNNMEIDESGNGFASIVGTWPYAGDGSGVECTTAGSSRYASVEVPGREDVEVTVEFIAAVGTNSSRWQGMIVRSASGAHTDGLNIRLDGAAGDPNVVLRNFTTLLHTWDLSALMSVPPVDGDRVRLVVACDGDDIILRGVGVNGVAPETIGESFTLTGADAASFGAGSGATWYGLYSNEVEASSAERFVLFEVATVVETVRRPDVELNPWNVWLAQSFLECNPGEPDCPPPIPRFKSSLISACLGCEFRPPVPQCLPSDERLPFPAGSGGYFGWWYTPSLPETSGQAYGFVFHEFTLTDPRRLSASRSEVLRSRVSLADGLILGEMVVEAFGADVRSSKWLADRLKDELETLPSCCPVSMDVYADCETKDGMTGLRRLHGVGEFHVTELDRDPLAPTSTMLSIVFSADTLVDIPDGAVSDTGVLLGETDLSGCETDPVESTFFLPKTVLTVDLELVGQWWNGVVRVCPVDLDLGDYDPATHFMEVREVRGDATDICPVEVEVDLTVSPPVVTPFQPTLYQSSILDEITANGFFDCVRNPIVVRRIVHSSPPETIDNPAGGGPCVYITLNGAGVATSTYNPLVDDLTTAEFSFQPCLESDCPGAIPDPAPVTVSGSTATPVGWSVGWLWPADTTGDRYPILTVDGAANNNDPQVFTSFVGGGVPAAVPFQVWRAETEDMSPLLRYRPDWSIVADRDATGVWVLIWTGGAGDSPPDESEIQTEVICGDGLSVLQIDGTIGAGDSLTYGPGGLLHTPAGGDPVDAFASGLLLASAPWTPPTIYEATQAALYVSWPVPGPWVATVPTVSFAPVPVSTP